MSYKKYNSDQFNFSTQDISEYNKVMHSEKRRYILLWGIYVFLLLGISIFAGRHIIEYIENSEYEDQHNIIKQIPGVGYNVYDKNGNFKEIKFFNDQDNNNGNIIGYINNSLIYNELIDTKVTSTILKNNTSFNSKTIQESIGEIEVISIKKVNQDNFIVLFKKNQGTTYCFMKNSLDFADKNNQQYCLKKNKSDLKFFVELFDNYYYISIDNKIYVMNTNNEKIDIIFGSKNTITSIVKNPKEDIKIVTKEKTYTLNKLILDYYLTKKAVKSKRVLNLNLDTMIK